MPRVRVIVDSVTNIGPGGSTALRGQVVELDKRSAEVMVMVGKCEDVVDDAPAPPAAVPPVAESGYDRRDMRAQQQPIRTAKKPRKPRAAEGDLQGPESESTVRDL